MVPAARDADAIDADAMATLVASRSLLGFVARSLTPVLDTMTMPQFRVLVVLDGAGPQRMGDVAERVGVHPSTLSRTVEKLVAGGWIERATSEDSRREVHVALSRHGRELVATVTRERRQAIAGVLAGMSRDDRAAVRRGMELFSAAAGEASPGDLLELGL